MPFTISQAQLKAFDAASREHFEAKMVEHLGEFAPELSKVVGEHSLRRTIQLGITRAGSYGLTSQGPVRLYLELMLLFGSGFDTDPRYPWAAAILRALDSTPQMQRAERLYERALDHQDKTSSPMEGPRCGVLRDIRFLSTLPLPSYTERNFLPDMLREITRAYPRETAHLGTKGFESLIRQGIDAAPRYQLSSAQGTVLLIALMLIFGHDCMEDPLHAWIPEALRDSESTEPAARARYLEKKALAWLHQLAEHIQ